MLIYEHHVSTKLPRGWDYVCVNPYDGMIFRDYICVSVCVRYHTSEFWKYLLNYLYSSFCFSVNVLRLL